MHPLEHLKLEGKARSMIDLYLALPVGNNPSCPYFNNRRRKSKSQLRVLKGKGTPWEIAEEVAIDALQSRINIDTLSADKLKELLVSEDLGIDCSGFAYHVLNSFAQERTGKSIKTFIRSNRTGVIGSLLARVRPAENTGVSSFANPRNTIEIKVSEAKPGDIITLIGTGKDGLYNHMVVITEIKRTSGTHKETHITYAHSYAWPSDGTLNHGVREGNIIVHGEGSIADLLAGTWTEKGQSGPSNYTYESARMAKELSVRRLKFNI